MALRFSVGHQEGGTSDVHASPRRASEVLDSLLRELVEADDEHYQVFVVNAAGESLTVFDNGLFAYAAAPEALEQTRLYYRPTTRDEALDILIEHVEHVKLDRGAYLPRFEAEPPTGGAGFSRQRSASVPAARRSPRRRRRARASAGRRGARPEWSGRRWGHADHARGARRAGSRLPLPDRPRRRSDRARQRWVGPVAAGREYPEIVELVHDAGSSA